MIAGIVALITALPELFALLNRLGNAVDDFMKWSKANNLEAWVTDLEKKIDALKNAKSPEQKLDAAQGLVSAIRNL